MRASQGLSIKDRKLTTLSDFTGIDANEIKQVDLKRASSMRNVMRRNGVNHKRWGWGQLNTDDSVGEKITYIYRFKASNADIVFFFSDRIMQVWNGSSGSYTIGNVVGTAITICSPHLQLDDAIGDDFITASGYFTVPFMQQFGDKLLLLWWNNAFVLQLDLVGQDYIYRWHKLEDVAYTPTTTISIQGYFKDNKVYSRATSEIPNLLTPWRINTAIGNSDASHSAYYYIDLDGKAVIEDYAIEVRMYGTLPGNTEGWFGAKLVKNENDIWVLRRWGIDQSTGELTDSAYNPSYDIGKVTTNPTCTRLEMSMCISPLLAGESNVEIKYKADVSYDASAIAKCTFGTTFGVNGASDQLFLAGNPDYPNTVRWSAIDDFTYFPETWYSVLGGGETGIGGFARLSDDTLCIFRDTYGAGAGIYFVTGEWKEASFTRGDDSLNSAMLDPFFTFVAGGYGESVVSHKTIQTFNGEPIYLSTKGVYGLYIASSNTTITRRFSSERGRSINNLLKGKTLTDAVSAIWQDKYILFLDGYAYVAEPFDRYKPKSSDYYQYEWYVWDNVPATAVLAYDGDLMFGTDDGKLCIFVEGAYTDAEAKYLPSGSLTFNPSTNTAIVANNYTSYFTEPTEVHLFDNYYPSLYYKVCEFQTNTTKYYITNEYAQEMVQDGLPVYVKRTDSTQFYNSSPYYLSVDRANGTFALYDSEDMTTQVVIMSLSTSVTYDVLALCPKNFYTSAISGNEFSLYLKEESTVALDLVTASGNSIVANDGMVIAHTPITFEWVTGAINNGTSSSTKTMLGLTIDCDGGNGSEVSFGYECRNVSRNGIIVAGTGGFDFEDMDFGHNNTPILGDYFSFEANGATSYTKVLNERNYNYIVFFVRAEGNTDFVLHAITEKFKYNNFTKGVK